MNTVSVTPVKIAKIFFNSWKWRPLQIKWDCFGSLDEEDGKIGEREPGVLQEDETGVDI